MLLVVDVGNTNTVLGVYQGDALRAHWRIETLEGRTPDEFAAILHQLFALAGLPWPAPPAPPASPAPPAPPSAGTAPAAGAAPTSPPGIVSSVVPTTVFAIERFFKTYLGAAPIVVGPGIKTGMPILYENPREVGADRIVNAVAAYDRLKQGCIVVDFGTATTFDVVTPRGEYLGGAITPGIQVSADALYHHAAKLPRVELARPARVVGRNTVASMQAGLVFGYAGMVDALVERMRAELDFPARCIATGGLAALIAKESRAIEESDEMLTLRGLKILFERNRS